MLKGTMLIDPPLSDDPTEWEAFLTEMQQFPDDDDAKAYVQLATEILAELNA